MTKTIRRFPLTPVRFTRPLAVLCPHSYPDDDPSGPPDHSGPCLDCRGPMRVGGNLGNPPAGQQRTDSQIAQDEEDEEFPECHAFLPVAAPGSSEPVAGRDVRRAIRALLAGWPFCAAIFPLSEPSCLRRRL